MGVQTLPMFPDQQFFEYDYQVKDFPAPDNGTKRSYINTESKQLTWQHDEGRQIGLYVPKGLKDENFTAEDFTKPASCEQAEDFPVHVL